MAYGGGGQLVGRRDNDTCRCTGHHFSGVCFKSFHGILSTEQEVIEIGERTIEKNNVVSAKGQAHSGIFTFACQQYTGLAAILREDDQRGTIFFFFFQTCAAPIGSHGNFRLHIIGDVTAFTTAKHQQQEKECY